MEVWGQQKACDQAALWLIGQEPVAPLLILCRFRESIPPTPKSCDVILFGSLFFDLTRMVLALDKSRTTMLLVV